MKVIYPGTFDPFSLGHLDLTIRGAEMFDSVVIAVSENARKQPMFTLEDRVKMIQLAVQNLHNVSVVGFGGLLVDLMKEQGITHVLRGVRGIMDFEYEFQMAQVNRSMLPKYEPVFLMPGEKYMVLNSTFIREVHYLGGDISQFIPHEMVTYIKQIEKR